MIMNCIITGFDVSEKYGDYKVIFTKRTVEDETFGVSREVRRTYVCVCSYKFCKFIGKEVVLELVKSPKTNELVVVSIKEVE